MIASHCFFFMAAPLRWIPSGIVDPGSHPLGATRVQGGTLSPVFSEFRGAGKGYLQHFSIKKPIPVARDGSLYLIDRSELYDVGGFRSFVGLLKIELHRLVLSKALKPASLNDAVMDEHVRRSVIRGDEPEAFLVVEPLHFSFH